MSSNIQQILTVTVLVWQLALTGVVIWVFVNARKLIKEVDKGNLIKVLEKVLKKEEDNSRELKSQKKKLEEVNKEIKLHIQKVGLIRFNPFKELGGDHSFSLALLDDKDSGLLLTGLHTRERTRVYIKEIKKGESKVELSSEEEKALKKAISSK